MKNTTSTITNKSAPNPFIEVKNLNFHLNNNHILNNINLTIPQNENLAFVGPNGSGKSVLVAYLSSQLKIHGHTPVYATDFTPKKDFGLVSFEFQRQLYAKDDYFDDTDFMDGLQDKGTLAREAIRLAKDEDADFFQTVELMDIHYLLDRGIRFLSTGEMRKVLIARALLNKPRLLVLDAPFEGLDKKSRSFLRQRLANIMKTQQCILLLNDNDPIITQCDSVILLDKGSIVARGPAKEIVDSPVYQQLFPEVTAKFQLPPPHHNQEKFILPENTPLISMKNVTVKYGDVTALNNLSWTVRQHENWLISGPNGAGKSTLLSLITADNPQAYGKDFFLFGQKRGSGETIWDIKKRIGIISSALQLKYKQALNPLQVVLSGFFESIGLYQKATPEQIEKAREWLELLEIKDSKNKYFNELSYGEQRMILLARAMVKHPLLLVLDEPCQGLDTANRQLILNLVDYVALNSSTSILYVSHCHEEYLQCLSHKLQFSQRQDKLFEAVVHKLP